MGTAFLMLIRNSYFWLEWSLKLFIKELNSKRNIYDDCPNVPNLKINKQMLDGL